MKRLRLVSRMLSAVAALMIGAGCEAREASTSSEPEPIAFELSDVQPLGTSEALAVVQDLDIDRDGTVWALNSVEPFFVAFDTAGNVQHEYGTVGGGPEEFRFPVGLVAGGIDGEVWAFDARRHALLRISNPERPWQEIALPLDSTPPGTLIGGRDMTDNRVRTARSGSEIILARSTGTIASGMFNFWLSAWGGDMYAYDPEAESTRHVLSLLEEFGDPSDSFVQEGGFPPFPLWFRLWAVCPDGSIQVHDRLRNQLRAYAPDGSAMGTTPLPPVTLTSVTHRQFARAVLGLLMAERLGATGLQVSPEDSVSLLNEAVGQVQGEPENLAQFLPRYTELHCADDGARWLRKFDEEGGGLRGGLDWLRIGVDGSLQAVRLPERFDAHRFTADRVWGVSRDEFDLATIAWLELPN